MRFETEQEGLDYLKATKLAFNQWIELKKYMFAPDELISLRGYDHRKRVGAISQSFRDHIINVFADWVGKRPRRRAILIVRKGGLVFTNEGKAEDDLESLNPHANRKILSIKLSPDGGKPETHLACSWNCAASEYDYLKVLFDGVANRHFFDGGQTSFDDAITSMNLKKIGSTEVLKEIK